jgi:predicted MFS family arabinose efflux permease
MQPAVALGLAMFLPAFGTHGLTAGRKELAARLGVTTDDWRMGLVMAVFALASLVAYGVMGRLGDRRGLRLGLRLGVAGYLVAHALLLASGKLAPLLSASPLPLWLGLRLLAGFCGGAITVSANALGALLYPPAERGRSLSLVWLGVPLAMVIGVPLPDYLGGAWSRLPEAAKPWLGDPYAAVATLAAIGVALLIPAALRAEPPAPLAPATAPADPAPLPSLRASWWVYAISFLMPLGVFPLIVSAEVYSERAFGFTAIQRGHLLLLLGAASVAGGLASGLLADRVGRRRTLLLALGVFTLLVPLLPWCAPWPYRIVAAVLGFVATVRQGPFQALASFLADRRGRGRLSARVLVSSQVGISLGQFGGSTLVRASTGAASLGAIAAGSTAVTAIAWLLARRLREPDEGAPR